MNSGPTQMDYTTAEVRWQGHPWIARALRIVVAVGPIAMSITLSLMAAHILPPYRLGMNTVVWWMLVAAASTALLLVTDRLLRRLLPLATLLRMTLIFPDHAPSRFGLAMRTGTTKQLERLIEETKASGQTDPSLDRAEAMLQLVAALSVHDRLTRGHCERVRAYTDLVIKEMRIAERDANLLRWSALLHDVGKLRVPAAILNSDRTPTRQEWSVLTTHPAEGMAITESLGDWLGEWRRTIGEHHERWDGNGYPSLLRGEEIHIGARIVAVADAFDVMTSARSYKKPVPAAVAREEIARCSGTQFDPAVVRAFLNIGLRRMQFALGPLAWLSNLPFLGQAPIISAATNALGGVATAGVLTVATVGVHPPVVEMSLPPRTTPAHVVESGAVSAATASTLATLVDTAIRGGASAGVVGPADPALGDVVTPSTDPTMTAPLPVVDSVTTSIPTTGDTVPVFSLPPRAPAATTTTTVTAPANTAQTPTTIPVTATTAPSTTAPPSTTTLAATTTTTTQPASPTVVMYLTRGGSDPRLLNANKPAAADPEPDADNDTNPGLTVSKDSATGVTWAGAVGSPTHIRGEVVLDLFSAAKNFAQDQVTLSAVLQTCNVAGSNCVALAGGQWTFKPWNVDGATTWTERQLSLGIVDAQLAAGSQLHVVLTTSGHDLWVALTGGRPSALTLPT